MFAFSSLLRPSSISLKLLAQVHKLLNRKKLTMVPAPNTSASRFRPLFVAGEEQDIAEELVARTPSSAPKILSRVDEATTPSFNVLPPQNASRSVPVPNTILDRPALTKALEDAGIIVKPKYIDYLYEHLHRQHYPSLPIFVQEYKKILAEVGGGGGDHSSVCSGDSTVLSSPGGSRSSRRNTVQYRFTRHRLPIKLLNFIADPKNGFVTTTSRIVRKKTSASGNSCKIVIALHDGLLIETNVMRYHEEKGERACVSVASQVGCDVGCTFCPVASAGFKGNLTAGEIVEQVVHAHQVFALDNQMDCAHAVQKVTFMGSGEPLNNYDAVVNACHALANKSTFNLCRGRITIPTLGITPRIYDLTRVLPDVILALGLHAPNQTLRRAIVPIAEQYPLDELIAALDNHMNDPKDRVQGALLSPSGRKRRMVMVEYIMMEGKTSSLECAHELGRLCENRHLVVNLIPYIVHGDMEEERSCPSPGHIKKFQSIVASYGITCNVRLNMNVEMSKMVARQLGNQHSIEDVPVDLEDLSFWQKLSFVRFRGWNEEALRMRRERRRQSVPKEITAKAPPTTCTVGDSNANTTASITEIFNVYSVADLVSSASSTEDEKAENKKEITNTRSYSNSHISRRWIIVPVAITAVVICKVMFNQRRR